MSNQKKEYDFTELERFLMTDISASNLAEKLKYIQTKFKECILYIFLTSNGEEISDIDGLDDSLFGYLFNLQCLIEAIEAMDPKEE
jgi:hypothetical protein